MSSTTVRTRPLDRRTLLRGAISGSAVALGLPALEIMLDGNGEAFAATGLPMPDRFGVWFWGNGVRPETWIPTGGSPWTPSAALQPLAALVPYVSVATGFDMKTAPYHPHHSGMTGIMTGQSFYKVGDVRDTIISTFSRQSVDQDAADWFSGQSAFRSLELGVCRFTGTDEGTTFQHLSHNGPNNPNPSEYSPLAAYTRLFSGPTDAALTIARTSVLSGVSSQIDRLKKRLGARDIERLDQHLESVRSLETRLLTEPAACDPGVAPVDLYDIGLPELIAEKNALMADVLVLALACDLTRAFSFQFSVCGGGTVFWQVGMQNGLHQTCHDESPPQVVVQDATTYTMEQLAYLLQRLADTPEGAGNLLEHSSILCTSEHYDGYTHAVTDFPLLIAGLGNGRLRGGVHHRHPLADVGLYRNTSDVVLTALRGAGVDLASWGVDSGSTSESVTELEV